MELFTLGVGHYTETDVKETARALTGWTVVDGEFREAPSRHDDGDEDDPGQVRAIGAARTWSGSSWNTRRRPSGWPGGSATSSWAKGPSARPSVERAGRRAASHHLDIGWAVATVLRSRAFFAATNLRTRVLGPVEFVVGAVRGLELIDPPPSTLVLADWSARLGQDLFYPPNVGGWPGGRSWLSARSLIGRANFAAALVEGRGVGRDAPLDPIALARRYGRGRDRADAIRFCAELLLGVAPDAAGSIG